MVFQPIDVVEWVCMPGTLASFVMGRREGDRPRGRVTSRPDGYRVRVTAAQLVVADGSFIKAYFLISFYFVCLVVFILFYGYYRCVSTIIRGYHTRRRLSKCVTAAVSGDGV